MRSPLPRSDAGEEVLEVEGGGPPDPYNEVPILDGEIERRTGSDLDFQALHAEIGPPG